MKTGSILIAALALGLATLVNAANPRGPATNPIIFADVPDMAMLRVGDTYYMSSTTMHMSPGLPIMKSKDLVNWSLASYAYDVLDDVDELNLANGKSSYGRGSWASSLRYHKGTYIVTTFAQTTGKTYIFTTRDIDKGPWKAISFKPALHDHSLFFDDDGRVYMLYADGKLPLVWQWNHNPDNNLWSIKARPGFLRLTTGRVDDDFLLARNTLTQRTFGPESTATTAVDVNRLKDGDFAGLGLLQKNYGLLGVQAEGADKLLVMVNAGNGKPNEVERVPLKQNKVMLKVECDFRNRADKARFFYSLDGRAWTSIGDPLKMSYTIPHFMGYRFGLFNYATQTPGGHADFDFLRLTDKLVDTK